MALNLYLGSSGAGKSHELYELIEREAAAEPERSFLLVVPEQFTLQTQRDMIAMSPSGGIMNIDVLSFPRLMHRIFEELGVKVPVTLEDTGKTMIVKKVALDREDRLGVYAGKVHRRGFIDEMKSLIAEFYQYGIGDEELERMTQLASDRSRLQSKLRDITEIYDGFREFISGRFMMNEELPGLFVENAPRSKILKNAVVAFDGFTGFTVMQLKVIECLMRTGCELYVTVTVDPACADRQPREEDLFFLSEKTIAKLTALADSAGCRVVRHTIAPASNPRFAASPALAAMERGIFRPVRTPGKDTDGIRIVSCESPVEEVRFVISSIIRLTAEEGYRYGDVGIIVGDMSTYARIADREFTRAGIPFFLDRKMNILGTAPVELLRAVISVAATDFGQDSVFRFLKTGLTGIGEAETEKLERYCRSRNIRGRGMWEKEWTGVPRSRYTTDLEGVNETRKKVVGLIGGTVKVLSDKHTTVVEKTDALKELLASCKVYETLEAEAEAKKESTDRIERLAGLEAAQLPGKIDGVFERICLLLGSDVMDTAEFADILDTGFSEAKLALIPQESDSVVIGDMERTRFTSVRALFILGFNDGMIPAVQGDKGLLSDAERSLFLEYDIELSPTKRESAYLSEFYLYLNLTRPTDRLFLSYHRTDPEGKPGRPSYVIGKLLKLYDGLMIGDIRAGSPELLPGSDGGRRAAAAILRNREGEIPDGTALTLLYELASQKDAGYGRMLDGAFRTGAPEKLTPARASELYGNILTGSVTMLETYASCAFRHFAQYGLRLEEQSEYRVGAPELGNIYHKALECYCVSLKREGESWHDIDDATRDRLEKEALEEAFAEYADVLGDTSRNTYVRQRVTRVLDRTIDTIGAQIRAGEFEPGFFEKGFRHAGEFMRFDGRIDRMDIYEKDGKKYIRVVDYKSGRKSFELSRLLYGLQIQLAVYMNEGRKEIGDDGSAQVTGMYYYNIDDPLIDEKDDRGDTEASVRRLLRMNGPSLDGGSMLRMHDTGLADENGEYLAGYASDVIPAETKKDGTLTTSTKVYTKEQFEKIGRFTDEQIGKRAGEILAGRIAADPYEIKQERACRYCPYGGICGFDESLGGRYRRLKTFGSEDEVWEQIDGALNSGK